MVPQTVRHGMADARRFVVVVVICRDDRVGVGVLYVEMVTTETVRVEDKTPATIFMFRA
jgi:hypothetical protein